MLNKRYVAILDMEIWDGEKKNMIYAAIPVDNMSEAAEAAEEYCEDDLMSVKIELLDTCLLTFDEETKHTIMKAN